jgi:hypothetical protein
MFRPKNSFLSIFGRNRPEIVHPLFGRIVYRGYDTWEGGRAVFPPINHEVEVIVHAGVEGPTESHVCFWKELIERWPSVKQACEPMLRSALIDWVEAPESGDIWSRVDVQLTVHAKSPPDEWELEFSCEEAGHWPTFRMEAWTPADCFVDG